MRVTALKLPVITTAILMIIGRGVQAEAGKESVIGKHVIEQTTSIVIQSHRGAGELAVENTLEAFELGWKMGTYPEADLRATSDGVIVAFHDETLNRVVKELPPGLTTQTKVQDLTWITLSKLNVGVWQGEQFVSRHVPRLTEVYERMRGRPERHLYLDIKNVSLPQLAREVIAAGVESQVVLATPKHEIIREWKRLVPQSDTLLWVPGTEPEQAAKLERLRDAHFEGITQLQMHVHLKGPAEAVQRGTHDPFQATDKFLRSVGEDLRKRGILFQTFPYGGSTREIYWKLMDLGAQSFATDHPDVTLDAVRRYEPMPVKEVEKK